MVGGRACLSVSELKAPSIMTFEQQSALCTLTSFTGLSSILTCGHPSFVRLVLANHGLTRSIFVSGCNTYHITGHHVITHGVFSKPAGCVRTSQSHDFFLKYREENHWRER